LLTFKRTTLSTIGIEMVVNITRLVVEQSAISCDLATAQFMSPRPGKRQPQKAKTCVPLLISPNEPIYLKERRLISSISIWSALNYLMIWFQ